MKRCFFLLACAAALLATLSSCQPNVEVYNPKCKISKIWYRSEVGDPAEVYQYDKKGMLTNITIDSLETYDFTYNKDKTVAKVVHVGKKYTESIDMTYDDDGLIKTMTYTMNDTVRQEAEFTRDEETARIKHVEETYDKSFFDRYYIMYKSKLYNTYMGDANRICKMVEESGRKGLTLHCSMDITYYPGKKEKEYKNIATIVQRYPDLRQEVTRTFTYDTTTFNPFYGMTYAYAGFAGYYVNNKATEEEIVRTDGIVTRQVSYTYKYEGEHFLNDKRYPRQFITISSENYIPVRTYILYIK